MSAKTAAMITAAVGQFTGFSDPFGGAGSGHGPGATVVAGRTVSRLASRAGSGQGLASSPRGT